MRFLPTRRHSDDKTECRLQTRYVCSSWLCTTEALNAPRSTALARPPHTVLSFTSQNWTAEKHYRPTLTVSTVKKKSPNVDTDRALTQSLGSVPPHRRQTSIWSTTVLPLLQEEERNSLLFFNPLDLCSETERVKGL